MAGIKGRGDYWCLKKLAPFNTLSPRQNARRFADDTFKRILLNENVRISIKISLKFVPKGLINNISVLVQIIAWRRPGDKPLSEPMMVRLPTHICVTRPQWVKHNKTDALLGWYHTDSVYQWRGFLKTPYGLGDFGSPFPGHLCSRVILTGWVCCDAWRSWSHVGCFNNVWRALQIISRKYTMSQITFTVRISSWKFVRVPKAWLWAHVQSFSLKFS